MEPTNFHFAHGRALTRRQFLERAGLSIGSVALGNLLARDAGPHPFLLRRWQ